LALTSPTFAATTAAAGRGFILIGTTTVLYSMWKAYRNEFESSINPIILWTSSDFSLTVLVEYLTGKKPLLFFIYFFFLFHMQTSNQARLVSHQQRLKIVAFISGLKFIIARIYIVIVI
jgi:uncharacterized protein YPO0396